MLGPVRVMGAGMAVILHVEEVIIHKVIDATAHSYLFVIVSCPMLTNPSNGMISNCSLGDDKAPSYKDTCSFTCNTGYELTGSDTRTCQSDGRWNGSDAVCRRGEYAIAMHSYVIVAIIEARQFIKLFHVCM